uniref:Uncharacterized protein n=1 Tax=Rhizophora mucronata TaxID=61149 RepID=A0A2P2PDM1_RHIMU
MESKATFLCKSKFYSFCRLLNWFGITTPHRTFTSCLEVACYGR